MTECVFVALVIHPLDDYKDRYGTGTRIDVTVYKEYKSAFEFLKGCVSDEIENHCQENEILMDGQRVEMEKENALKRKKGVATFKPLSFDDPRNADAKQELDACSDTEKLNEFCKNWYPGEFCDSPIEVRIKYCDVD